VNSIFLANIPSGVSPVGPTATREAREQWIIAKYVEKKFTEPNETRGGLAGEYRVTQNYMQNPSKIAISSFTSNRHLQASSGRHR